MALKCASVRNERGVGSAVQTYPARRLSVNRAHGRKIDQHDLVSKIQRVFAPDVERPDRRAPASKPIVDQRVERCGFVRHPFFDLTPLVFQIRLHALDRKRSYIVSTVRTRIPPLANSEAASQRSGRLRPRSAAFPAQTLAPSIRAVRRPQRAREPAILPPPR